MTASPTRAPANHHISCAHDVVERVTATVDVAGLGLRHTNTHVDGGEERSLKVMRSVQNENIVIRATKSKTYRAIVPRLWRWIKSLIRQRERHVHT